MQVAGRKFKEILRQIRLSIRTLYLRCLTSISIQAELEDNNLGTKLRAGISLSGLNRLG